METDRMEVEVETAAGYTPHPPPSTLHPIPYTFHPTPHTLHPPPYTLNPNPQSSLERPWMACVGSCLYLRSPAMAPDSLVVIDCATLAHLGAVRPGGAPANAGRNFAGQTLHPTPSTLNPQP